jgi:hypothetical protein
MESQGGMIMIGETDELGKNLSQCQFAHYISHMA